MVSSAAPLQYDSRLLAPPRMRSAASSELSSLGDLHDDGASSTMFATPHSQQLHSRDNSSRQNSFGYDSVYNGDPQPEHLVVRGEIPSSDLSNVNTLFVAIGVAVGIALAVGVVQIDGARDAAATQWLLLPGELFANAMLCVVLPTIFLNSVLGSMHFSTLNKTKALGSKMLVHFFVLTLWASVLGALLAICFVPTFSESNALQIAATGAASSSSRSAGVLQIAFRCPQRNSSQSLLLQSDGSMRCTQPLERVNGSLFRIKDIAHTFRIPSSSSNLNGLSSSATIAAISTGSSSLTAIPSLGDQAQVLLETLFPMNLFESFLRGDVLSVILIGVALGVALLHFSLISSVAGTSDSSLLFLLFMQSEVILSVLLRVLLKTLPIGMVFMVCGAILRSPRDTDVSEFTPSMQDLASLVGVLLFALVLDLTTMLAMASVATKSNPLPYIRQLLPAQLVALGSSSSLIALPTTVRSIAATKQVSMPLAHFVCSTGTILNKSGSAVYLSVASVYIVGVAGLQGHELNVASVVVLILASVLCAMVLPPLPRGSILVVGTILTSVFHIDANGGVHVLLAFLAAMDWLCDPFVTVLNVTSSAVVALILAHQMDERFRDQSFDTQEEETDDGLGGLAMLSSSNSTAPRPTAPMRPFLHHQDSSLNASEVSI